MENKLATENLQQSFNNSFPITGIEDITIAVLELLGKLLWQSLNNFLSIQLTYWESNNSSLYFRRGEVNCWDVPIIIEKKKRFWETAGAIVSYLLS